MSDFDDARAVDKLAAQRADRLIDRVVEILFDEQVALCRAQAKRAADGAIGLAHREQARHERLNARVEALSKA